MVRSTVSRILGGDFFVSRFFFRSLFAEEQILDTYLNRLAKNAIHFLQVISTIIFDQISCFCVDIIPNIDLVLKGQKI